MWIPGNAGKCWPWTILVWNLNGGFTIPNGLYVTVKWSSRCFTIGVRILVKRRKVNCLSLTRFTSFDVYYLVTEVRCARVGLLSSTSATRASFVPKCQPTQPNPIPYCTYSSIGFRIFCHVPSSTAGSSLHSTKYCTTSTRYIAEVPPYTVLQYNGIGASVVDHLLTSNIKSTSPLGRSVLSMIILWSRLLGFYLIAF